MTMQLFWLECLAGDVPADTEWLSPEERLFYSHLRFQKRRNDWLLGRWTAKSAIAACLQEDARLFPRITILADSSGAPLASIDGLAATVSVSISHRAGRGLAVLGPRDVAVGADLEFVEPRGRVFTDDYFTPEEIDQLRNPHDLHPDALATLIWSAKESALKLLQLGLKADTRCVSISVSLAHEPGTSWKQFDAVFVDGRAYRGWWQQTGEWVHAMIGAQASPPPIELLSPIGISSAI